MADQLSSDLAALRIDRATPPRRGNLLARLLWVGVALGAAAGGYKLGVPYHEAKLFKPEVEVTEIAVISPAQASVELTSTGYIVAQVTSKVAPKVMGKVSKSNVREGMVVKEGDILFEIDPADQRASIASASSQTAVARARAQTARANLNEARQQLARAEALARDGIGPKSAADDLTSRVAALEEMVKAADAEARAQGTVVGALNVTLESFTVKAPIGGTVVNKPPEIGEFVGPQPAGVAVDMGGVEIADFSSMMVETDVPEARLSQVKLGGPAEIVLDAYPDKRYRGKAIEVTPRVNRTNATVTVKVAFVDDRDGVIPDMAARVSFLSSELDKAELKAPPKTIIPGEAVATRNGAKVAFVLEDARVRIVPLEVGPAFGSGFELKRGPPPGTRLVKNPAETLTDGQGVKEKIAK